nr:hypothetical protein [uncultured Caldimonas sp.]
MNCGDDEQAEFISPRQLRFLRQRSDARLFVCPECGTYWHVDHMQRGAQAIKIPDPFRWESFDDKPIRLKYLERHHGGCDTQQCIWQGCEDRALKGMALCVRHAYPEFGQ